MILSAHNMIPVELKSITAAVLADELFWKVNGYGCISHSRRISLLL